MYLLLLSLNATPHSSHTYQLKQWWTAGRSPVCFCSSDTRLPLFYLVNNSKTHSVQSLLYVTFPVYFSQMGIAIPFFVPQTCPFRIYLFFIEI